MTAPKEAALELCGVICMDKPEGFTSFDVVAKLRGILRLRRLGHGGTLDPMATGVLPVFVGRATRAIDLISAQDKIYAAGFTLGITTDTYDSEGQTLSTTTAHVRKEDITALLPRFSGDMMQTPPMYSAIKINGQKLYQLARKGIEVERPSRPVHIHSIDLVAYNESVQGGTLRIHCSKGTYIRSIIHELGQLLGCGAVMSALRREMALGFTLAECHSFADVEAAAARGEWDTLVTPVEHCFADWPAIRLEAADARAFANGVKLPAAAYDQNDEGTQVRVIGPDGFLGLGQCKEGLLLPVRLFAPR